MACYLFKAGDTDKVKIGFAIDVDSRRREIQSGCWERLVLLRTWMDGDKIAEGWLHRHFAASHISRDWFTFHSDMLSIDLPDLSAERKMTSSDPDPILSDIEEFLTITGMTPTAFGRLSLGDPLLVTDIKRGREVRRNTRVRIAAFINSNSRTSA